MAKLDATSRLVTHHQITIDTKFRNRSLKESDKNRCSCPVPTMEDIAPLIIEQIGYSHKYQNGEIILNLQDAKLLTTRTDKKATHLGLLINAVDKNGSITVIKNTETKHRLEVSPKHKEGEGYEVSSHILISLTGSHRIYDTVLMPIPGVSTGRLNLFLDRVLFEISKKHEKKFTCKSVTNIINPNTKKTITVTYKPVFEINGKLDQELFNKINKEGLSDVTLVKNEFKSINAPDIHSAIIPKESTLKIEPNHGPQDVVGWLKNLSSYFKDDKNGGYELIKIKFKEPDTDAIRQVSLNTDSIRLDALEKNFIKKSIVDGFSSRLKDSYDSIEIEAMTKMINIM